MNARALWARVARRLRFRARFETKVVFAVVLVSLVPLVVMLALGQGFLSTAIKQGLNPGIEDDLMRGFRARREVIETLMALYAREADVIARDLERALPRDPATGDYRALTPDDAAARAALRAASDRWVRETDALARLQVLTRAGDVVAESSRADRLGAQYRTRLERRALPDVRAEPAGAPLVVLATFSAEWERFHEFERAGRRLRLYSVLRRTQIPATLRAVLIAELAVLPVAIVASIVLAWWVARGVTRRVKLLALATERVGQGDLTVRVRPRGEDEVDDLIRAFNAMVADMQLARTRIDYLQRIGAWQDFAKRLAHEIKNPLTPIQLAIQEVAKKYRGDDAAFGKTLETAREVIEEEIETLRRLVAAFSSFARLPDVKTAAGDLAEFVRDAGESHGFLDEAAGGAGAKDPEGGGASGVEVLFEPGDAVIPVLLDRMMLRRALDNLVRNAVQAGARKVWVRAERRGDQGWLIVDDDGPGIPEALRARVFDPYYTTREEGSGLGLAIVRKLAFDHRGDVGLEERPGGGARFIITLPIVAPGRDPRPAFVTFGGTRTLTPEG